MQTEVCEGDEQGFLLKNREGVVRIVFTELEYVEVINKKVFFHLADSTIREMTAALTDYEKMFLNRPEFVKPHRSYLVNLNYIQSIGTDCIVTKNGHSIPLSRQRHHQIEDDYLYFLSRKEADAWALGGQAEVSFQKEERPEGPWRILLVDDSPADRAYWADILKSHGCMVQQAESGEEALKQAADASYDCVLLDVMIPGEGGFSICERIHKLISAPVIFLSSHTESDKQVEGFEAGGIDYITKDTSPQLFWAKVETRIKLAISDRTWLCYEPLLLDLKERRAFMGEKELSLTPVEFELLWHLSEHGEHIFSLEEIFEMMFAGQLWDGGQMVQMHMSRLRRKLEKAWKEHCFIETVWGQGYRFVPPKHSFDMERRIDT